MERKFRMAVVRGVQPRMSEIQFYSYFREFDVRFLGDKTTGWVVEQSIPKSVSFVNLPLRPAWGFDPITAVLGPLHAHRSWQYVSDLETYLTDVDVINISDMFYFYSGQCARLAKKLGKKLVTVVWENVPHHISTYLPPYSYQVRSVLENTDLFLARSKKSSIYLQSLGVEEHKIRVIYKGIDLEAFRPGHKNHSSRVRILYVGQLVATKGVHELLEAFTKLYEEFQDIELWICARSSGEPLENRVKELGKHYPIRLLEQVPYTELPKVYKDCDIYCHLSEDWKYLGLIPGGNDWFPYAVLEAMACGLPVVATGVGGIPEQLGEHNIIVEQKNANSAYCGLRSLVMDKKRREHLGKENVLRMKQMFDIKKQAELTEQAILEVLER